MIACSFYCIHSLSHGLFFVHLSPFEPLISSFQTTIFLVFLLFLTHLLFFYIFILQFCLHSFFLNKQITSIYFFLVIHCCVQSISTALSCPYPFLFYHTYAFPLHFIYFCVFLYTPNSHFRIAKYIAAHSYVAIVASFIPYHRPHDYLLSFYKHFNS